MPGRARGNPRCQICQSWSGSAGSPRTASPSGDRARSPGSATSSRPRTCGGTWPVRGNVRGPVNGKYRSDRDPRRRARGQHRPHRRRRGERLVTAADHHRRTWRSATPAPSAAQAPPSIPPTRSSLRPPRRTPSTLGCRAGGRRTPRTSPTRPSPGPAHGGDQHSLHHGRCRSWPDLTPAATSPRRRRWRPRPRYRQDGRTAIRTAAQMFDAASSPRDQADRVVAGPARARQRMTWAAVPDGR
ncbi:hypothetical protein HBB16_17465 [Pseudonocardia sp. MCCB 268]|nr:hypothetical protein [Pseudonocardia cytotoxica]